MTDDKRQKSEIRSRGGAYPRPINPQPVTRNTQHRSNKTDNQRQGVFFYLSVIIVY
jgi:hypothetical protein